VGVWHREFVGIENAVTIVALFEIREMPEAFDERKHTDGFLVFEKPLLAVVLFVEEIEVGFECSLAMSGEYFFAAGERVLLAIVVLVAERPSAGDAGVDACLAGGVELPLIERGKYRPFFGVSFPVCGKRVKKFQRNSWRRAGGRAAGECE